MKYPFKFKILCYDYEDEKYYTQTGLGLADSYGDAAHILEERAKDELVSILCIELFEEDSVIMLPEEVCELYAETEFPDLEWSVNCNYKGEKKI